MLLFLLVFFLLSSCFETVDLIDQDSALALTGELSLPVTLLDANNNEITLSTRQIEPTTLYANQARGTILDLNLPNARGASFVDIRKIEPAGDTLRREISQPGFSHLFQLTADQGEQLYGVSRQNGEEFYIKITAQPTLIVNIFGQKLYQSIPYTLSFAGIDIKLAFEGAQSLNRIQILPYNFSDSSVNDSSIFLEYQDKAVIDVVEMTSIVRQQSMNVSDLYQLRINMATDVLGHRSFSSGSYFLRQINPGAPLRYAIASTRETLQERDISFCSEQTETTEPCPSSAEETPVNFGRQGRILLEGLSVQTNGNPIERVAQQPIAIEQSFGREIQFSSSVFQNKTSDIWESFDLEPADNNTLISRGPIWLVPELDYKDNDLLSYDSFVEVSINLPEKYSYRTQKLSFRFPCSRVVVQEPLSKEYRSLDDYEKYADLRDNRAESTLEDDASFPSSLGLTALNIEPPPLEERQVCTDYTGAGYDNYYILPSVSESSNNQWRNLKFALAWDESWNYEDFSYSFIAQRERIVTGVEWENVPLDAPADSQRYIAFDLLQDTSYDKTKILRYRLRPVVQSLQVPEARYERPINYYFIRYPQLYPGMKKLYLENPEEETYKDNELFIDLAADFRTGPRATRVKRFFQDPNKDAINQTLRNQTNYYQLVGNTASLKFLIPTDDRFDTSDAGYEGRLDEDRRKVKSWNIVSETENVKLALDEENNYRASLSIKEDVLQNRELDRVLLIKAKNETQTRACSRITASLTMIDGDTTSSEFFLCVD